MTHSDALVKFFKDVGLPLTLIDLEAGLLSQWLHAGLTEAGFETVLMETRHVKKAPSASTVKDRSPGRTRHGSAAAHGMVGSRAPHWLPASNSRTSSPTLRPATAAFSGALGSRSARLPKRSSL